ncbi:uncharacterized protein LOC116212467 isoform X2 [Punica granatum]|uniref:Uncharacterized protein LOC116212467 isoform X2 n=2 Tax=Punica granatum TaxID=22663 RepID=A0A6P8ECE7_PUNGR|nr:uncharacterized protein LOC116212467 isoform X2 [Punica granatum]PKI59812.1 hypothetical protein CRG98_019818 [Punica granatum]
MGESVEELDSLFDYSRVQPVDLVDLDDDDEDEDTSLASKRQKTSGSSIQKEEKNGKVAEVLRCEDEDEEDWLAPPPKFDARALKSQLAENSTLMEIRRMKQELLSVAKSAKDFLQDMDRPIEKEVSTSEQTSGDKSSLPPRERAKIVVSIQDKDGVKQFRIYADDKFQRLFKLYADKAKLSLTSLVFSFDGDKISPTATPESLGMEDNDIVEVCTKSS